MPIYKKPVFWIISALVVISIGAALCFLLIPRAQDIEIDDDLNAFLNETVISHNRTMESSKRFISFDLKVLSAQKTGDTISVYMWVLYQEYDFHGQSVEYGVYLPTVVTAEEKDGKYTMLEYLALSRAEDIRAKFPRSTWDDALDSQKYLYEQALVCEKLAAERRFMSANELSYCSENNEELNYPRLILFQTGCTFQISFSPYSSYIATGRYELEGSTYTLKTDDGLYTAVFNADGHNIIFDPERSDMGSYEKYFEDDNKLVGSEFAYLSSISEFPHKYTYADIDGDGEIERCVFGNGLTLSAIYTFAVDAYTTDDGFGTLKYHGLFSSDPYDLSFVRGDDGKMYVQGKTTPPDEEPETHLYEITVRDDAIVLSKDGEELLSPAEKTE